MVDLLVPTSYGYGIGRIDATTSVTLAAPRTLTKTEYDRAKIVRIAGQTSDGTTVPNMSSYWTTADWANLQASSLNGIQYFPGHANWDPNTLDAGAPYEAEWRRDLSMAFHWWMLDNYFDPIWSQAIVGANSKLLGFTIKPGTHIITFRPGQVYTMESGFVQGYLGDVNAGACLNTYYVAKGGTFPGATGCVPIWNTDTTQPANVHVFYPTAPRFALSNTTVEYDQLHLGGSNRATIRRSTQNLPLFTQTFMYGSVSPGTNSYINCQMAEEFRGSFEDSNLSNNVRFTPVFPGSPDYPLSAWIGKQCLVADLAVKGIDDGSTNGKLMPMPPAGGFITGDNKFPRIHSIDTVNNIVYFTTERDWLAGQKLSGDPGSQDVAVILNSGQYVSSGTNPQFSHTIAVLRPDLTLSQSMIGARAKDIYFRGTSDAVIEVAFGSDILSVNDTTKTIGLKTTMPQGAFVESATGTFLPGVPTNRWQWIYDPDHNGEANSGIIPNGYTTSISVASNTAVLPQSTINVASTATFPSSGRISISASIGGKTYITYTGKTGTSFTGCSDGSGTVFTGDAVISCPTHDYARIALNNILVHPRSQFRDNLENSMLRFFSPGDMPPGYNGLSDAASKMPGKIMCQNVIHQNGIIDGGNDNNDDNAYNNKQFWYNVGGFGGFNISLIDMDLLRATSDTVSFWPRASAESLWAQWNTHWLLRRCNLYGTGRHTFVLHSIIDLLIDDCDWKDVKHWIFDNESQNGRMIYVTIQNSTTENGNLGWFSGAPGATEISPYPRVYAGATLTPGSKFVTFPNASDDFAAFSITPYGVSFGRQAGAEVVGDLTTGTYFSPGTYIVACYDNHRIELNKPPTVSSVTNNVSMLIGFTPNWHHYTMDNNKLVNSSKVWYHKFNWPIQRGYIAYYGHWDKHINPASLPQPSIITLDQGQLAKPSWLRLNPDHAYIRGGNNLISGVGPASYPQNADIADAIGLGNTTAVSVASVGVDVTTFLGTQSFTVINGTLLAKLKNNTPVTSGQMYVQTDSANGYAIVSFSGFSGNTVTNVNLISGTGHLITGGNVSYLQTTSLLPTPGLPTMYLAMEPGFVPPSPLANNEILVTPYSNGSKQARESAGFLQAAPPNTLFGIPEKLMNWPGFTFTNNDSGVDPDVIGGDADYVGPSMLALSRAWTEVNVHNNHIPIVDAAGTKWILGYYDGTGGSAHGIIDQTTHAVDPALLPISPDGSTQQWFETGNDFDNCADDQIFVDAPTTLAITSISPNPASSFGIVTIKATLQISGVGLASKSIQFYTINPDASVTFLNTATTNGGGVATIINIFPYDRTWPVYASFAGQSGTYAPSTSAIAYATVGTPSSQENTITTLDIGSLITIIGTNTNLVATVTSATTSNIPDGDVIFSINGTEIGTVTLPGNGIATIPWVWTTPGDRTVLAEYQGSADFNPSSDTKTVTVRNVNFAENTFNVVPPSDGFGDPHL